MAETWTILKVLDWTAGRFQRAGVESPRLDAQVLLGHVLACDRVALYTQFDRPLSEAELGAYRELIRRRLAGEPVAYLVGEKEFWSLPLAVDPRVLVPRPDTETLVQVALEAAGKGGAPRIADVGTGSGAIAIALAREIPGAAVIATDVSAEALAVARANAERHGLGARIDFREGDLLEPLASEALDLLVANLPYVPRGDIPALAPELQHEPVLALDGGEDGLDLVRRLVDGAPAVTSPGATIALEHGADQGEAVAEIARRAGAAEVSARADLGGRTRVTWFRVGDTPTGGPLPG